MSLEGLRERLPSTGRLLSLLPLVVMVVIILVHLLFIKSSIFPQLQARSKVAAQYVPVQKALKETKKAQEKVPTRLKEEVATAQATLKEAASVFLTESQAAEAVNRIYQYAGDSGVEITGLQAQAGPKVEKKDIYDARTFRLQAQGDLSKLLDFVSHIKETAYRGFQIGNMSVAEGPWMSILTMDLTFYTSPYSSGAVMRTTPITTPIAIRRPTVAVEVEQVKKEATATKGATAEPPRTTATPTPILSLEEQLAERLHQPWAAGDWEEAIRLIKQIRAINPDYDDMTEKLYAAHVNYGRKLAAEGKLEAAKEQFSHALAVKPDGGEALLGLRELASRILTPPPTLTSPPRYIVYTVRAGDTLYSIARQHGTTVRAIMAANGLSSYDIRPGQQLRILVP